MEASEFIIAQKTDTRDLRSINFNYATGWRYIAPEPYPIVSQSTDTEMIGDRIWLLTEVGYSNAGNFVQYLTWYQTLINGTLISLAISPDTAIIILPSFHTIEL
jgi:hypothetical protein